MIIYSVIMFSVAALFGAIGISIYKGKTDLIHDYHQTKVSDKSAYGKAFGKAMLLISISMLLSGIVNLLGDSAVIVTVAMAILFIGLIVGIACIVAVQKKYNNGIF